MSLTCALDHLGGRSKFEMDVDEHNENRNIVSFNSHPALINKSVDSISLIETDNNKSSLIITIEEPTEKYNELKESILHDFGSCNSNIKDIFKSCFDNSVSSNVDHNHANVRSAALIQNDAPPIVESTGDISASSSCESDYSISNFSTSTLNSTAHRSFHECTVPGCRKKFSRPSRLQQHSRIHTGERPYVCPEVGCGRSYTRSQHLLRHTQIAHSTPDADQSQHASTDTKCDKCGKQFGSIYSLRKHLSQYHERRKYSCTECGQVFLKQQHMRSHTQTHSNEPAFSCDFPGCTASFYLPSKLQRHKLLHVPGRYKCTRDPTCKQVFDRHVDLRRHLASQHPFVCAICGVEFTEQSRYNRHRTTHEDLRLTYHCTKPGCGRCYYSLRALTSHVRDSHDQRPPQHECAVCTKRFATKQKLQQHLKTHGPDCGRVVKRGVVKKRITRCDKGLGRTDYRSLLAGLTPGNEPPERLYHPKIREAVENSEQPIDGSNPEIENPLVGEDIVLGTRRLLEGSAVARREFAKTRQSNISNWVIPNIKGQNLIKRNQPLVSLILSREVRDSGTVKSGSPDIQEELGGGSDQESKPKDEISTYTESDKIDHVFISGQGAIKQSSVLLARLSDRVVDMLDTFKLAGSGK